MVLAWADRSRIVADDLRVHLVVEAALLVDGDVHGVWALRRDGDRLWLDVRVFRPVPAAAADEVEAEGARLLAFAAGAGAGEAGDVRVVPFGAESLAAWRRPEA